MSEKKLDLEKSEGEMMVKEWLQSDPQIKPLTLRAIKKLPPKLKELSQAVENNAVGKIEFKAHDLKGFALNFNFSEIYSISKAINEEAKNDDFSYKKITELHEKLQSIIDLIPKKYLE